MIVEASEFEIQRRLHEFFETEAHGAIAELIDEDPSLAAKDIKNFDPAPEILGTCIVQLRALGLIEESERPRSVRDTGAYWTLTPYGDGLMTRIRAIRSPESPQTQPD